MLSSRFILHHLHSDGNNARLFNISGLRRPGKLSWAVSSKINQPFCKPGDFILHVMQYNNDDGKDNRPQLNESKCSLFVVVIFVIIGNFFNLVHFLCQLFSTVWRKATQAIDTNVDFVPNSVYDKSHTWHICCNNDCQHLADFCLFLRRPHWDLGRESLQNLWMWLLPQPPHQRWILPQHPFQGKSSPLRWIL